MKNKVKVMSEKITNTEEGVEVQKTPKKRRRKPKNKNYFGEEQEKAFREFLLSDDERYKNRIFAEEVYPALCKMIECLIRRYYLFIVDESYEETFYDTLGFLMTKIKNFKPSEGKKAYSYCGTVCKRYLISRRQKSMKEREKVLSYETVYSNPEKDDRVSNDFNEEDLLIRIINQTKDEIRGLLECGRTEKRALTNNEVKVGNALMEILNHWEDMIEDERSRKFTKVSLLYFIKEYTLCNTTEVRNAMKIYKNMYLFTKQGILNE